MGLKAPQRPCAHRRCPKLTRQRYCEDHRRDAPAVVADKLRGTSNERGYTYSWRERSRWYRMRHAQCEWPLDGGCTIPSDDTDHIVPRDDGGSDDDDNLQALCRHHHSFKTWQYDGGCGRPKKPFPPKSAWRPRR